MAKLLIFLPLIFLLAGPSPVLAEESYLQGDTVIIALPQKSAQIQEAVFGDEPVSVFPYKNQTLAVFGIAAGKPAGSYPLKINFVNGETFEKTIRVRARRFAKIILPVPEKVGLAPKELVKELGVKQKNLADVVRIATPNIFFNDLFGLPLADNRRVASPYGEIRKTGTQEIRHLGVDFGAKKGAAVYAINSGVVRAAYYDSIYGNSVFVDHGAGIFSLYLHLDQMFVKESESVKRGRKIGTVGDSGLASAPHLHLSLKINGVSVDPFRFVYNFK